MTSSSAPSDPVAAATTTLQEDKSIDENDAYLKLIQFKSIRNKHGLEEAISVQWHTNNTNALLLSTLLQPDDLAPLFDGAGWAGTRVWHAAIASIQFIVENALISESSSLLELGCGLGVPAMMLQSIYNCRVCLTDQESILSQLEQNVKSNFEGSSRITARPLSWSKDGIATLLQQESQGFDVVLNCDCVYEPLYGDSWKLLVECIDELLKRNPKTLVVTSVERRAADGIDTFLETLKESPHVASVSKAWQDDDYRIEIYIARGHV
jgi:predicted nicotinamide N-methyase